MTNYDVITRIQAIEMVKNQEKSISVKAVKNGKNVNLGKNWSKWIKLQFLTLGYILSDKVLKR